MDVLTPDGTARTFRVATPTSDVPGQVGERVTVACACTEAGDGAPVGSGGRGRRSIAARILPARPPGKSAGEPMGITNHTTGAAPGSVEEPSDPRGLRSACACQAPVVFKL